MSDLPAEQPTEAEVENWTFCHVRNMPVQSAHWADNADYPRLPRNLVIDCPGPHEPLYLAPAIAVSPLREQVQKLTEENERLRGALERIAASGPHFGWSKSVALAALEPSSKGEQ